MNRLVMSALVMASSVCAVYAEEAPTTTVKPHGNIAAAQNLCDKAIQRVSAAEKAHGSDLDGHATRAKELLNEAKEELKLADEVANNKMRSK